MEAAIQSPFVVVYNSEWVTTCQAMAYGQPPEHSPNNSISRWEKYDSATWHTIQMVA